MTPERIRQVTAEKIMGWKVHERNTAHYVDVVTWTPDLDRNQSRMVVEKAYSILAETLPTGPDVDWIAACHSVMNTELYKLIHNNWGWMIATPLQECEACLRALGLWEEQ